MKIAFLLFAENLSNHRFKLGETNPGVGGTQFTTIQLAFRLALAHPDWTIVLINPTPVTVENAPDNLVVEIHASSSAFFAHTQPDAFDAIVATVHSTRKVELAPLRRFASRLVAWSRHPYDDRLRLLDRTVEFAAVVSVGRYQYYSNSGLRSPSYFIQNVFCPPLLAETPRTLTDSPANPIHLVHLGALVRGKGFEHIASIWPTIRARHPGACLHVIGSGSLYRDNQHHSLIPARPDFANRILTHIPEDDIQSGRVTFHGALGREKFDIIRNCHIALQNPTGETEAFPASTLECMSLGLPVIGSADFGMWDSMRYFPELQIRSPSDIPERVDWLVADPHRYRQVSDRAIDVARECLLSTDEILNRWEQLLKAIQAKNTSSFRLPPPTPLPKGRHHFMLRILKRHWRIILSASPMGTTWRSVKSVFTSRQP